MLSGLCAANFGKGIRTARLVFGGKIGMTDQNSEDVQVSDKNSQFPDKDSDQLRSYVPFVTSTITILGQIITVMYPEWPK